MKLPPVHANPKSSLELYVVMNPQEPPLNPHNLSFQPSESTVLECRSLLTRKHGDSCNVIDDDDAESHMAIGVKLGDKGNIRYNPPKSK